MDEIGKYCFPILTTKTKHMKIKIIYLVVDSLGAVEKAFDIESDAIEYAETLHELTTDEYFVRPIHYVFND